MTWLATAAAVAVATGGVALASNMRPDTSIHACVSKSTGDVRIAGRCTSDERAVWWNQRGPAGPRGRRGTLGLQGVRGIPGATGPSHGYFVVTPGLTTLHQTPSAALATLTLPAGKYLVSATVDIEDSQIDGVHPTDVVCTLSIAGTTASYTESLAFPASTAAQQGPDVLTVAGSPEATTTATVTCNTTSATSVAEVVQTEESAVLLGQLN